VKGKADGETRREGFSGHSKSKRGINYKREEAETRRTEKNMYLK